jgi:autotransporter-associated beta strand protein
LQIDGSIAATSNVTVNNGGTLGGTGSIPGTVTVNSGGTLAAGSSPGTITLGALILSTGSTLAFELGQPQPPGVAGTDSDLINVTGALTLDGVLNVNNIANTMAPGVYRLINYGGAFTDSGLALGAVPGGFVYGIDVTTGGQVNLLVDTNTLQFWDGPNTVANAVVDGGTSSWDNVTTNWTTSTGSINAGWSGQTAVFQGAAGIVTLADNIAFQGMQFITNGYVINPDAGGTFTLSPTGVANMLVNPNITATINARITGSGGLAKIGAGTLILTGANAYTGGTNINAGTLGFSNGSLGSSGLVDFLGNSTLRWNTGNTQDISSRLKIEDGVTATFDTNGNNVTFASSLQLGPLKTAALTKTGKGTLMLTAANTYTGATTVINGVLAVDNNGTTTFGTLGSGPTTIQGGAGPGGAFGTLSFRNNASAGSGTFTTNGGSAPFAFGGLTEFDGNATAGSGTFTNNAGTAFGSLVGGTQFSSTATAGSGTFTNNAGTAFGSLVGGTQFSSTATAGSGTFTNNGGNFNGAGGGYTLFTSSATAGSGTFTNNGGTASGADGGHMYFYDVSTAGSGTFTNNGGTVSGEGGGFMIFFTNATAGGGTFTNNGGSVSGALGGGIAFLTDGFNPGSGTFTNNGGTASGAFGGTTAFAFSATAGSGTFTTNGGAVSGAFGGTTEFSSSATAASGTFTTNGGAVSGAFGGATTFGGSSAAATSTLIANGGTGGGLGGGIVFTGSSTGGTSTVKLFGNGFLDIIGHTAPGVTIGSLEGSGNVFLGANNLTVGSNGASTLFSGIIRDQLSLSQGTSSGSLTKIGAGTLELTGANLYTGATTVQAGTLRVNNTTGSATGTGAVTVQTGATLTGAGTITGPVTVQSGAFLVPGNSPGTLTLGPLALNPGSLLGYEYGPPNIVNSGVNDLTVVNGNLTLDGTLNLTALPGFGIGTYRVFNYTGALTDNVLDLGTVPGGFLFTVDVATANQVNLIVAGGGPLPIAWWDGANTSPNNVVDGGTFTWDNTTTNWTTDTGTPNGTWASGFGFFAGEPGVVTIIDNIAYTGLQFITNGYLIQTAGAFAFAPTGIAPLITNPGVTATISAPITGPGGVAKEGAGTLIFTGASTYTGPTIVNDGTLLVNGSTVSPQTFVNTYGVLGGNGTLFGHVFNFGTVSPGTSPGTLHIEGNYEQSSEGTLRIEVGGRKPGEFDVLEVGGHASLDGKLELVRLNNFKLKRGDRLEILTADGGVEGEFDNVINPFKSRTILRPAVIYEDKAVVLTLIRRSFVLDGLTPNQRAVARALDRTVDDRRMEKIFAYLDERYLEKLPGDYDKIAPEELSSIFALITSLANVQSTNLQRRTDDLRHNASGFSASGFAMNGTGPGYSGTMEFRTGSAGPTGNEGKASKEIKAVAPPDQRWGAFLTGVGEWVDGGSDYNARGYGLTTGGFTLGVDYKVCPNFAVGIAAGYAGTGIDLTDDGSILVNGGKLGLYATTFVGGWYADAAVTGGYNGYDTKRAALQGTARGSTHGGELNVLVGTGYDWKLGALQIGPTATFNYTLAGIDGYTERGSLAPLNIASRNAESVRSALGFKASYDWKLGGVVVKPEIRAAWQHEYGDSSYGIDGSFANGAVGGHFLVNGPEIGRDSLLLGAGFAVQLNERAATYLYYDGELGRTRYDRHAVSGGIRIAF